MIDDNVGDELSSSTSALFDSIDSLSSADDLPLLRNRSSPSSRAALTRTDAIKAQLRYWAVPIAITVVTMLLVVHVHRSHESVVGLLVRNRRRGATNTDAILVAIPQLSACRERHLAALLREELARDVVLLHSTARAPTDAQLQRLGKNLRVAAVPDAAAPHAAVNWLATSAYARAWIVDADAALGSACAGGWTALLAAHDSSGARASTADYVAMSAIHSAQRIYRVSKRFAALAAARRGASHASLAALCGADTSCQQSPLSRSCLITECWSDIGDASDASVERGASLH